MEALEQVATNPGSAGPIRTLDDRSGDPQGHVATGYAIRADGVKVSGSTLLNNFSADGALLLVDADIAGSLICGGAHLAVVMNMATRLSRISCGPAAMCGSTPGSARPEPSGSRARASVEILSLAARS